jgi:hypothetical protein
LEFVASLLIDTSAPEAQENEAETLPGASPGGPAGVAPPAAAAPAAAGASCPKCSAPLAQGQDWCLQCGAGAPAGAPGTGWRPAALVLAVTAALVLGAAAAGYAALSKHSPVRKVMTATVAQAPPPATVPTTPVTPTSTVPATPVSPPKIPLTAQTPTTSSTPPSTSGSESTTGGSEAGTTGKQEGSGEKSGGKSGEAKPKPLLLDTDAASTYDPDEYPTALFGDPSLAIDGDTSTAWTAQLDTEATVPLSAGVLLNLKSAQKLGSLGLVSATQGMTVQVFVAQVAGGEEAPAKIEDPAWVEDSKLIVVKKHHMSIKLTHPKQGFDYLLLWVSKAGAASAGTATAPGHVSVNELELFRPAKKKS